MPSNKIFSNYFVHGSLEGQACYEMLCVFFLDLP